MKQEAFQAVKNNDLPALREVFAKSSEILQSTDHRRDSLLHVAARYGDIDLLAFLKDQGIDVNISRIGNEVYTPLHKACRYGRIDAVKWLLNNGAAIEAGSGRNATPLIAAAMGGNLEVVRLLLEAGADARASYVIGEGENQRTLDAISISRIKGNEEVTNYLEALA